MALIEFENYPSTDSPINAANLNNNFNELNTLISNIYNQIFPIGRGFLDFTDTDYSNYLGFTWERELIGKVPVGIDSNDTDFNTIGKAGGEKEHILTLSEIPANNIDTTNSGSAIDGYIFRGGYNNNGTFNFGGQTQPHNNLQPYEVVAYWKNSIEIKLNNK